MNLFGRRAGTFQTNNQVEEFLYSEVVVYICVYCLRVVVGLCLRLMPQYSLCMLYFVDILSQGIAFYGYVFTGLQ